jgi:hypothetical protein
MNDDALASAIRNYADSHFAPIEEDGARWYRGGTVSGYTTALFALGEAGGLQHLRETLDTQREPRPVSAPPPDDEKTFDYADVGVEEIERMNQAIFAGMGKVPGLPPRETSARPAQEPLLEDAEATNADTTAADPDTPTPPATPARFYELQIQITLPVAQFPTEDDLNKRHQLEDGIEQRGAGAILDVSTRMGMMELFVETEQPAIAEAIIQALIEELGLADTSSITRL